MLAPLVGSMIWSSPPAFSNLLWASPPQQKSAATESRCKKKILGCRRETVGQSVGRSARIFSDGRAAMGQKRVKKMGPQFPEILFSKKCARAAAGGGQKKRTSFQKNGPNTGPLYGTRLGGKVPLRIPIACLHDRSLYNHVCSRSFAFVVACLHDRLLN